MGLRLIMWMFKGEMGSVGMDVVMLSTKFGNFGHEAVCKIHITVKVPSYLLR